ncbi:MAG: aminotransferase class I/II-fold pyridoxal phosphate-dependent enzyme [Chitinophagaceae bacterium]|nr:aminotransferase class I/II-fold pyridoxal phosphate-dependent enzyme [Chitinophagaceae bacterium]
MIVDLRSDTVTRPTAGMLEAMMGAEVGDDVFREDVSVNKLELLAAEMFGMEAALYCPTGTMSNQVAIRVHTQPGDEVICDRSAHVYQYEGGGIASNSGAQVKLIEGDRGRLTAEAIAFSINPDDVHKANTSLVCLENTSNRGGGSCYDLIEIQNIRKICDEHSLSLHLDGARLFNALVARNESPQLYGSLFHSISVCLNKGLGCPIGSVLMGEDAFIKKARRIRKVFGGGMRQAGYMAVLGIYALQNQVERLHEDHRHAQQIAAALSKKEFTGAILPVETNIIIFSIIPPYSAEEIAQKLRSKNILQFAISPTQIRMVLHLDITPAKVDYIIETINAL